MDAGWGDAAGMLRGNAPEVADPEAEWACLRQWGVMQVIGMLAQESREIRVFAREDFERSTGGWDVDLALGISVPQAVAGRTVVGAQPRIRGAGRAVDVPRENVSGDRPTTVVAKIALDAIQGRVESTLAEQIHIREHGVGGEASCRTQRQSAEEVGIECDKWFPMVAQAGYDVAEITRQSPSPAEGIHVCGKRRGDQRGKVGHDQDAGGGGFRGRACLSPFPGVSIHCR